MLAVYLSILFKHPWGWGGDLDTGPASCKWPLAGRSTRPQWPPLPETGKSCLIPAAFLPTQMLPEPSQQWEGGEEPGPCLPALKFLC